MEWIFFNSPAISVVIIYGFGLLADRMKNPLVRRGFKSTAIYLTWPWIFYGASPVWWMLLGEKIGGPRGLPVIGFGPRDLLLFVLLPLAAIYFASILIRQPLEKTDPDYSESIFYYQMYPLLQLFFWIILVGRGILRDL